MKRFIIAFSNGSMIAGRFLFLLAVGMMLCYYLVSGDFVILLLDGILCIGALIFAFAYARIHIRDGRTAEEKMLDGVFRGISRKSRLFKSGISFIDESLYNNALECFQQVREAKLSDREKSVLSFYLGRTYHLMGYYANAAIKYAEAIEGGVTQDIVYIFAARCEIMNGDCDTAMRYYTTLMESDSQMEYILTDVGMMYLKNDMADKALEYFMRSINEKKNVIFARGGCALAYLLLDRDEESRELYENVIVNGVEDIDGFKTYYAELAEAHGIKLVKKETDVTSDV